MSTKPLPRDFYDRDTVQFAKDLLGCRLHRRVGDRLYVARVVETEAYCGPEDLACHASKGLTPRTEPMFGPPGHAYVYFIYGLHHCLNAVTEAPGSGTAVLIRAVEPLEGFAAGVRTDGPARLTKALSIDKGQNQIDLTAGDGLWFEEPTESRGTIEAGKRIGVDYAGAWAERPWRFWLHSPCVSVRPRGPGVGAGGRATNGVLEGTPIQPKRGEGTRRL
jgi:DNA-3-methyladenine glycosylase